MAKKIILIGPPAAGKTSLRKFFFEGISGDQLLQHSEPASIGMKYSHYEYVYTYPIERVGANPERTPFNLAVLDTAGQELETWLNERQYDVFTGASVIIFVFQLNDWNDPQNREYISNLVMITDNIRVQHAPSAQLYILGHKMDAIAGLNAEKMRRDVQDGLQEYVFKKRKLFLDFKVRLTSLCKEFRQETFSNLLDITTNSLADLL